MLGPAQTGSERDNFFKNIVLETFQKFSKGVLTGNGVKS